MWPIFVINSICCPKLYLLPNLVFQNTMPFWFSIQPEPHAVTKSKETKPLSFPCGVLVDEMPIFICYMVLASQALLLETRDFSTLSYYSYITHS